jgi:hypothetical protein
MARTEWDSNTNPQEPGGAVDVFPPGGKDFDQVGPASGDTVTNDAPAEAEIRAANNAFGSSAAGNAPSDPGWDLGAD